ncbi:glycopeptide antibiotics resistance protein [Fontibacillus phaseoli]|uniref:Glycopeptide antibiotics resistance protein n=1 Tax=Fontibacillus phaseoli TaxID=1416533 RepID=A0A369BRV7_9BACL|nr:glycopeptide antibiotics resistance protein [Fontibacillus phaseoli]
MLTLFILYFMFLAFGRVEATEHLPGYTFIFLPENIFRLPALSDLLHPSLMTLVDFGNTIAFVPFGVLFPWLYRTTLIRFITLFFIAILVMETLQALTFLGSFDINDAIQNTIGAAVGFGAYKLGFRSRSLWRNLGVTALSGMVLLLVLWGLFGALDKATTKVEGPFVAINVWMDSSGHSSTGDKPGSIQISHQTIRPRYNMYGPEGGGSKRSRIHLRGRRFSLFITESLNLQIIPEVSKLPLMEDRS